MKRRLLTLATALLVGVSAFGQLADGSVAPNFTVTDINGNSHTLYDYLDQGYTVVMDLNATWCEPCWNYHESGALEELWADHGPEGQAGVNAGTTNDVIVFMIESDASTTSDDLTGTGDNTYGDWTAGVDFIIVDDASVANAYNLAYYPTIFTVCPNRILTESGPLAAAAHYENVGDCENAVEGLNAAVLTYEGETMTCGGDLAVSVVVQNMGTENLTAFDIDVLEDGTSIASESFSGNLSTYDVTTIDFGNVSITNNSIEINITSTDANGDDNSFSQNITLAGETNATIEVVLLTDNYAPETYLELVNSSGTVVWAEGNEAFEGNYGTGDVNAPTDPTDALTNNTEYSWEINLPNAECYTLHVYDYYGDGLGAAQWGNGNVDGEWSMKDNNGTVIATGAEADFGAEDVGLVENKSISNINDVIANHLNIYPNPVSTTANIVFSLSENAVVNASLVNVLGETVKANAYQLNAGNQKIDFDVTDVSAGVYFLQLNINGQATTQKITVAK